MPDLSIYRADEVAEQLDADVIYFEGSISQILAHRIISECNARRRRTNVLFIMVTLGGDPNAAYRIARCLQMNYTKFLFYAPFHCKSAGTLVATGAHELVISNQGELGPLDVQLSKKDELVERQSGLTVTDTLNSLQDKALITLSSSS